MQLNANLKNDDLKNANLKNDDLKTVGEPTGSSPIGPPPNLKSKFQIFDSAPYRFLLFFFPFIFEAFSSITACAAANLAIGTRNGEALT